jgi:hypothetical protein
MLNLCRPETLKIVLKDSRGAKEEGSREDDRDLVNVAPLQLGDELS